MEGITMRSGIVSGVGNLCSLGEDRLACASSSHASKVGTSRQLSSSSALRCLGWSNVTNFPDGDQVRRCRRSGSSASIVCSAKSDGTRWTEHLDKAPFHLSAVAVPILAAVMLGVVQPPNVQAVEPNQYPLESDRFAAPDGGGQFSAPSAGGKQPNIQITGDRSSTPSKGKETSAESTESKLSETAESKVAGK